MVDQTGLGSKKVRLCSKVDPRRARDEHGDRSPASRRRPRCAPDIFAAIQQQLGLKLVSTKAPVDVIVIDHVEKPSEH